MNEDPLPSESSDSPALPKGVRARSEEQNLWDLDSESEVLPPPPVSNVGLPPAKLPERRKLPAAGAGSSGAVQTNVTAKGKAAGPSPRLQPDESVRARRKPELLHSQPTRLEKEFNELDSWETDEPEATETKVASAVDEFADERLDPASANAPSAVDQGAGDDEQAWLEGDFGEPPVETKVAEKPRRTIAIKPVEWLGLAALVILLAGTAVLAYRWTVADYSQASGDQSKASFPVAGERVTLLEATTFWRAPVLDGPDRDSVRRGTRLVPVVVLEVKGGPSAIRLRFKNDTGVYVGDPLTVKVSGSGKKTFVGTAGFEDMGMHAAYRIGETDPWVVEVSEAESVDSSGDDFSLIHEIELAAELR